MYRHHVEPRVKLCSPREESFPIPLKYIDVSRIANTNLDVKQESRIDDNWKIDGSRDLSDSWTGFTQFTLLEEKPPDGYMWSGVRLTRKQLTSRPDHLWPELLSTAQTVIALEPTASRAGRERPRPSSDDACSRNKVQGTAFRGCGRKHRETPSSAQSTTLGTTSRHFSK